MKIVLAGLEREEMEDAIKKSGKEIETFITTDMKGAKMVKKGEADFYFGACNTGAGAAISIAIGLLGFDNCCTVAKPGQSPNKEEIEAFVKSGKVAFGMSIENIDKTIPLLLEALVEGE